MARKLSTPGEPTTETHTEVDVEHTPEAVASNVPTNDVPTLDAEADKESTNETQIKNEVGQMSQAEMQAMILSLQTQLAQQIQPNTTAPKAIEQRSRVVLGKNGWTREYY